MTHLKFCPHSAYDNGVTNLPQVVMRQLGIEYKHTTPQSHGGQWWFWNCTNIPEELPEYLSLLDIDPVKCVGFGLSASDVEKITSEKFVQKDNPKIAANQSCVVYKPEDVKLCWGDIEWRGVAEQDIPFTTIIRNEEDMKYKDKNGTPIYKNCVVKGPCGCHWFIEDFVHTGNEEPKARCRNGCARVVWPVCRLEGIV